MKCNYPKESPNCSFHYNGECLREHNYECPALVKPKKGKWTTHEVACLLAEATGDDCACNVNGNDEWLPYVCDFGETTCPNVVGVTCWEQFLKHRGERKTNED